MSASAHTAHFELLIPAVRNDFKVLAFEGSETISGLYAIKVEVVSEYHDVKLETLLSQPAFLRFGLNGEGLHGRIEDVRVGESGKRLTHYQLVLVPALHYLQFSYNQRIFQQQTVPQIITQVLQGHGIQADAFTFKIDSSTVREYCTQYAEHDLDFVKRLCAEEGIAWHHQHSPGGHLLVFTNHQMYFQSVGATPYQQDTGMVADHPVVSQFSQRLSTRTSAVTRRDYDFKRPSRLLESQSDTAFTPALEDYRYPQLQETEKRGMQLAREALERHRSDYLLSEGKSDQPTLRCGHYFDLSEHPRQSCNAKWLLLSVTHEGKQPQVLEESAHSTPQAADGFTQGYRNHFSATPWDVFYRPPLITRQSPLVAQTARVTGPAGEEIFCDEYGRVKVEFPWDRAGLGSDKSSCWLRVSSSWAGEHFGAVTVPRVGMEVVVTFLEGDPDQPLITGCVPNKVTAVPYPLPANKTRTVLRSRSSPANGGYNELLIEDRSGQELIALRAQRDMQQKIENDSRLEVGNQRHETIKGNSIAVLEAEDQRTVSADRKVELKANDFLHVSNSSHTQIGQTLVAEAGVQVHLKAGASLVLDAGAGITLKAGGQHLVIGPGGVFSSVPVQVGGAPGEGAALLKNLPGGQAISAHVQPPLLFSTQRAAAQNQKPLCTVCNRDAQQGGTADE